MLGPLIHQILLFLTNFFFSLPHLLLLLLFKIFSRDSFTVDLCYNVCCYSQISNWYIVLSYAIYFILSKKSYNERTASCPVALTYIFCRYIVEVTSIKKKITSIETRSNERNKVEKGSASSILKIIITKK